MAILYRAAGTFLFFLFILALTILMVSAAKGEDHVAFLFIPGVSGNSVDPAHRNWIEVLSCDWGSVPPPRGGMVGKSGQPAGKLCFGEFSLLKPVDDATPTLAEWCLENVWVPEMRVAPLQELAGGYKLLVLKKVKVKSVRPSGDGVTEVLTLAFGQVEYR